MLASGKHLGAHLPETHARHASLLPGCTVHTGARSASSPTGCTPAGAQEIMPARAARPCSPSLAAAAAVAGVSGTDSHATTACASFKAQRTPASLVSYGMVGEGGTGARQRSRSVNPWRPGDVPPRAAREAPHPGCPHASGARQRARSYNSARARVRGVEGAARRLLRLNWRPRQPRTATSTPSAAHARHVVAPTPPAAGVARCVPARARAHAHCRARAKKSRSARSARIEHFSRPWSHVLYFSSSIILAQPSGRLRPADAAVY